MFQSVNVALLAVPSFESAMKLLRAAKKALGEVLSAFEFFDSLSMKMMLKHFPVLVNFTLYSGLKLCVGESKQSTG